MRFAAVNSNTQGHVPDADLAEIYNVPTRALNQAVRRNRARFPTDFAFLLSSEEWGFTEHGAIMAASSLTTSQAVETSVCVVRAFVRLKELTRGQAAFAAHLAALERKVVGHDADLKAVFAGLRAILEPPKKAGRPIGFRGK